MESTPGRILAAKGLNVAGKVVEAVPKIPGATQFGGQAAARVGAAIPNAVGSVFEQATQGAQQNEQTQTDVVHESSVAPQPQQEILSPGGQWKWDSQSNDWVPNQQTQNSGISKEKLMAAIQKDPKNATKYMEMYKLLAPGADKPLSSAQTNQVNLAKSGIRGLTKAEQILGLRDAKGNEIAGGKVDMGVLMKQLVPGQYLSRDYEAAAFAATEALLRARSGAAVPETEVKRYQTKLFPAFGDSEKVVKQKLVELRSIFGDILNQKGAGVDPTELPSSPSLMFGGQ
jgi:hypothetical protein